MSYIATPSQRPEASPVEVFGRCMEFRRVQIMGVVNVTPDSFSDGGRFFSLDAAVDQALALFEAGAQILDVGGESTRPGAAPVSEGEELDRVVPVIEALSARCDAFLSVDTYKASVARAAVEAGAHLVNDISGLGFDENMAATVAELQCALVLMHIRNDPQTMQKNIAYKDVIEDIGAYFRERLDLAEAAGISKERIILDPGIGFGKTVAQNYRILRELSRFKTLGHPLLIGTSRKSFIGAVTARPAEERLLGTAASVACAIFAGADIVRVHDVAEMVDVVRVSEAVCGFPPPESVGD